MNNSQIAVTAKTLTTGTQQDSGGRTNHTYYVYYIKLKVWAHFSFYKAQGTNSIDDIKVPRTQAHTARAGIPVKLC